MLGHFRSMFLALRIHAEGCGAVCARGEGDGCLYPALRWCTVGTHGYEGKQAWLRYR